MKRRPIANMELRQLSGLDAGFLYMETPTLHMHTLKVAIVNPEGVPGGIPFRVFRRVLERKLQRLPSFQQRLMEVPLGLGHPAWVVDHDFDLSRHINRRRAAAPGGMRELNAIVSEIASIPLQRDRPLWEITMVDGLHDGRVAFVCKLHHSMADGTAALGLLLEVLQSPVHLVDDRVDGSGQQSSEAKTARLDEQAPTPTRGQLLRWAGLRALQRIAAFPALLWQTLQGLWALGSRILGERRPRLPAPFSVPRTPWNGALTARRSFATTELALEDLKRIKRALGVSLNDVLLGICGGALRAHLLATEGQVPSKPLTASVPVNTHPELVGRTVGNHVGHLTASLCTHIADPADRIVAIGERMAEAKGRHEVMGPDVLERWIEFMPPAPYARAVRFWSERQIADLIPPPVSLVVSNVPGPSEKLRVGGAELDAIYSVGPILEGIGLNITGWSYAGRLYLVGLGCPDHIPDLQSLIDRLPEALEETLRACEPQPTEPAAMRLRPPETVELRSAQGI